MVKFIRFMLIFFIVIFVVASIAIIICAIVLYTYSSACIDRSVTDAVTSNLETEFYYSVRSDANDNLCCVEKIEDASLTNGFKHEYVAYNEIPQQIIDAFISVEDKRFFEHNGIDRLRSAKAAANFF